MVKGRVEQGSKHQTRPQLSLMETLPASLLWGCQLQVWQQEGSQAEVFFVYAVVF